MFFQMSVSSSMLFLANSYLYHKTLLKYHLLSNDLEPRGAEFIAPSWCACIKLPFPLLPLHLVTDLYSGLGTGASPEKWAGRPPAFDTPPSAMRSSGAGLLSLVPDGAPEPLAGQASAGDLEGGTRHSDSTPDVCFSPVSSPVLTPSRGQEGTGTQGPHIYLFPLNLSGCK